MSNAFPRENTLEKSDISGDPIRGGSIGINRVLGYFVDHAESDRTPTFTGCILSAFTILRNVHSTLKTDNMEALEQGFVTDIRLFMEYYNIYLGCTKSNINTGKKAPVVIYFPNYHRIEKDLLLEPSKSRAELFALYKKFFNRTSGRDEKVQDLEHASCFWIRTGDAGYPHRELVRKFREITSHPLCLYKSGDTIAMMSHIAFDFHIAKRLRGIMILESNTGRLRPAQDIRAKLDKSGFIPFMTTTHVVFGDGYLIKPLASNKIQRSIREQAEKERWLSRSEDDIQARISKTSGIPLKDLRKFDFV
jgi:hypothetical protein